MAQSTAHKHDSPRTPRATYQDVLDAPVHRVAEIVDGTLHVSPRPPTLAALAKTRLSAGLGRAFDRGRDGPGRADGGSSTSPSSTSARTSWSRTSRAGGASACRNSLTRTT